MAGCTLEAMRRTSPTGLTTQGMGRELFEHVLHVARRLASSSDLHEVLGLIIDTLRDSLHADRVSVFQYDPSAHELFATKAHGLPQSLRLAADKGIIGEAARTKLPVNIPDAYADPRFNPAVDRSTGYQTRCMLTIPLLDFEGKLVGVAQLLNKDQAHGGVFTAEDEVIAQHLADQAAVALKRAQLLEARRIKEKLEADIDVARKIQTAALPRSLPAIPGYDIAVHFRPADETAGDAYDVLDLRQMAPEGGRRPGDALLFMADATGHGIGPALSVAQVLAMVRMGCRLNADPRSIALNVNYQLCADLPIGRFVTAFLGALDASTHTLTYLSAGQAPLLFVRASMIVDDHNPDPARINANAMPFGVDEDFPCDLAPQFVFEVGDLFVLLSDGYYEAADDHGRLYGIERVLAVISDTRHASSDELLTALRASVAEFVGGLPPADDQTAVVVKRIS